MRGVGVDHTAVLPDAVLPNRQDDDAEVQELYTLLHENYVETSDQMFRFDYSVREPCSPPLHSSPSRAQTTPNPPLPCGPRRLFCVGPSNPLATIAIGTSVSVSPRQVRSGVVVARDCSEGYIVAEQGW